MTIDLTEDFWSLSEQLHTHKDELVKLREENAVMGEKIRVFKKHTDAKHMDTRTRQGGDVLCDRCTFPILMEEKVCIVCGTEIRKSKQK